LELIGESMSEAFLGHLSSCVNTWLGNVSGLSSLSAAQQSEFKLSFLSSLYSGILSGIVTGLVVGIVIYVFQKRFEKRQLKISLEREISIFKEKARVFLGKSGSYKLTDLEKVPEYVTLILELIELHPLDLWKECLPEHRELISKLRDFQRAFFQFEVAGSHLNIAIRTIIRKYNAERDTIAVNDNYIYGYYVGKLDNMEDDDILAWLDISKKAQSWIAAGHAELKGDDKVINLEKRYLTEKQSLEIAVSDLRKYLGMAVAEH
jgi:hypothetical protein